MPDKEYCNYKATHITTVLSRIEKVTIREDGAVFLYLKDACVDGVPVPISDFGDSSFTYHLMKLIESWKF